MDQVERIQKLMALAGNNPSHAEAASAWAKAQVLIKRLREAQHRDPTDVELAEWFVDAAAPCDWVLMVSRKIAGGEYVAVVRADMLVRNKQQQAIPMWRVVQVPLRFRGLDPVEILQACTDGRIAWRSPEARP